MIHMMQRRAEANLLDAVATYFHRATPGLGPHIETPSPTSPRSMCLRISRT